MARSPLQEVDRETIVFEKFIFIIAVVALALSVLSALFVVSMQRRIFQSILQEVSKSLREWARGFGEQADSAIDKAIEKKLATGNKPVRAGRRSAK
jgi:hypothetical protein